MQNSSIWTRKNMLISKNITNEEVVEKTAKEIVHDIKLYIMPFLNRYTDMNHVIEDEENRVILTINSLLKTGLFS